MGCGQTKPYRKRAQTDPNSVDGLKTRMLMEYKQIQKRFGHPTYYQYNGYEINDIQEQVDPLFTVHNGMSKYNRNKVTIKERHLLYCQDSDIIQEVLILSNLSHKCLPQLNEVFITDTSVFTVTCHLDGARLSSAMEQKTSPYSLSEYKIILRSILEATEHCHHKNIVIRNLTPSNICVKRTLEGPLRVMIADFALSVVHGSDEYVCDSPFFQWNYVPFMAPEALLGDRYNTKMDMWMIGVLIFVMVTGVKPFWSDDDIELMRIITTASFEYPKNAKVDVLAKHLIGRLVSVPADQRLSAKDVLKHNWILSD